MSPLSLIRACVFLSGGVALVLQLCLSRFLSTLTGAAAPSVAIVIVMFFVGMALGSVLVSAQGNASRKLAVLELFIAFWCAFIALYFYQLYDVFVNLLIANDASALSLRTARIIITAFWIMPPTIAIGMHFPLCVRLLEQTALASVHTVRNLYILNVLGAAFFTLIVPYSLFYWLGLDATLLVCSAVGAGIAFVFWKLQPTSFVNSPATKEAPAIAWWICAISFLSGVLFFALEMLWFHTISTVIPANVYAIAKLLAILLVSLAIAGVWVQNKPLQEPATLMKQLLLSLALLAFALPFANAAWPYLGYVITALSPASGYFLLVEIIMLGVLFCAVAPIAILAGSFYPAIFNHLHYHAQNTRAPMATLLAYNTLGCIAGTVLSVYVFIPQFGAEKSFTLIWYGVVACTLAASLWYVFHSRFFSHTGFVFLCVGVAAYFTLPAWDYMELQAGRTIYRMRGYQEGAKLLYKDEEFNSGFMNVLNEPVNNRISGRNHTTTLVTNGKFEGNDSWQLANHMIPTTIASLHLPQLQRAMILGVGTGYSTWMAHNIGFKHVDACEISPKRFALAQKSFPHLQHNVFGNPSVMVHFEDGRNYLLSHPQKYDLITVDLNAIWFTNATNLYSREFYRLVNKRLTKGGILEQFVQPKFLTHEGLASILASAQKELSHVYLFNVRGLLFILASNQPLKPNVKTFEHFQRAPYFVRERSLLQVTDLKQLPSFVLLAPEEISRLITATKPAINTDSNRLLEMRSPFVSTMDVHSHVNYLQSFKTLRND